MIMRVRHRLSRQSSLFRSKAVHVASFLFLALILPSCLPQQSTNTPPECPVPEQNCRPGSWAGRDFAGVSSYGAPDIEHRVDMVSDVNSPRNEIGLSFTEAGPILTAGTQDKQSLVAARSTSALSMRTTSPIAIDGFATVGVLSTRSGSAVVSGVELGAHSGEADLYQCSVSGTAVKGVQKIAAPISLPLYWDSHPALSPKGDVLFFASDRPGGYGGTDIWYSVRHNNTWSAPVNCGAAINSACDELTPFVTTDGTHLLFASAGHQTVGGYDLFIADIPTNFYAKVRTEQPAFGSAQNFGAPINTTADELAPSSPARCDTLMYFASNRPAPAHTPEDQSGGFDLYVLHVVPPSRAVAHNDGRSTQGDNNDARRNTNERASRQADEPATDSQQKTQPDKTQKDNDRRVTVRGRVTESTTRKPVSGANITVRDTDNQKLLDRSQTDTNGRFAVQVPVERDVEISAQGKQFFYDSERLHIDANSSQTVVLRDFALPGDLSLRINFPNDEYSNPYPYLLDSNGIATSQTWQEALDLLAENLKLYDENIRRLILVGHTDDVAGDAYNKTLGMRRAQFVVNELIKRGIAASKLEAQSQGEQRLLPRRPNESEEQYRVRCRRVDLMKVMSFILPDGN